MEPQKIAAFIRQLYHQDTGTVALHAPLFAGREKELLLDCVDSTFVSSVGRYVSRFEEMICELTGAAHAVATVNGTSALHAALLVAGVQPGDEVLTQPLSFVATTNAIMYCGARPVFLDVETATLGLDPVALRRFISTRCRGDGKILRNASSGARIAACVPMHTFGHPCQIDVLADVCAECQLPLIEDAAEALGSTYLERHCGTFGLAGIYSFNGNKIVTTGGGGIIVTNDPDFAKKARHLTTTAKKIHPWAYDHDQLGYNYRMPNLNAALGCAQLAQLDGFVAAKRGLALAYRDFFKGTDLQFFEEPAGAQANYWLQAVLTSDACRRDSLLEGLHGYGIQARPAWTLLHRLPMYQQCQTDGLEQALRLAERLVNLPSSVIP